MFKVLHASFFNANAVFVFECRKIRAFQKSERIDKCVPDKCWIKRNYLEACEAKTKISFYMYMVGVLPPRGAGSCNF